MRRFLNRQINLLHAVTRHSVNVNGVKMAANVTENLSSRRESDSKHFNDFFDILINDMKHLSRDDDDLGDKSPLQDAIDWFIEVAKYNVPHGKRNRGLMVLTAYRYLVDIDCQTDENVRKACVLGWCIEIMQAYFLIADDIMDKSLTRRGQPCWYTCKGVGSVAINDSFFLSSFVQYLLTKYLKEHPSYIHILELFIEVNMNTVLGQCLDLKVIGTKADLSEFTMDRYMMLAKYKTAFYSFYLPVAAAMHLAGISDPRSYTNAKAILIHMGIFFQIQDDYLDCYGDVELTGKIGTDIQDHKCSWLIIQAWALANSEERLILQQNYGCSDPESVSRVKGLYDKLSLPSLYQKYEEKSYTELLDLIDRLSGTLPKSIFTDYANRIYKRLR